MLNAMQLLVVMVGMSAAFALRVGELLTAKFLPLLGVERRPCLCIIMLVLAGRVEHLELVRLLRALLSDEVVDLLVVGDAPRGIVQSACCGNDHSCLFESAAYFGLGDEVIG